MGVYKQYLKTVGQSRFQLSPAGLGILRCWPSSSQGSPSFKKPEKGSWKGTTTTADSLKWNLTTATWIFGSKRGRVGFDWKDLKGILCMLVVCYCLSVSCCCSTGPFAYLLLQMGAEDEIALKYGWGDAFHGRFPHAHVPGLHAHPGPGKA